MTRSTRRIWFCGSVAGWMGCTGFAGAAILSAPGPIGLDVMMGAPLFPVVDDGMPVGTLYGNPATFTPGILLPTPIGPMGFGPSHARLTPGTPTSSGAFLAMTTFSGPILGSTLNAPMGTTAFDFLLGPGPSGVPYSFEVTAIGSVSTLTISVPASPTPVYVGFGSFGESIIAISIVDLSSPPTTLTWAVDELRVLPAPSSIALLGVCAVLGVRRRRVC